MRYCEAGIDCFQEIYYKVRVKEEQEEKRMDVVAFRCKEAGACAADA